MRRGDTLPSFEGATLLTKARRLKSDQPVIVFFWSVSCEQCEQAFQLIHKIRQFYPTVQIITVHMPRGKDDLNEEKVRLKYSLQETAYHDEQLMVSNRFGNRFVPAFYVFDQKGLRFSHAGNHQYLVWQRIQKILSSSN